MLHSIRFRYVSCVLLILLSGGLFWNGQAAEQGQQQNAEKPTEKGLVGFAPSTTLGGDDRYLTYVSTDKAIYRPGEMAYVRGVVLHHASHRPVTTQNQPAIVTVIGPKGDTVASGYAQSQDSVLGFAWLIPAEMPGGQYKFRLQPAWAGQSPAERAFEIRAYRAPRLKSQIKFVRDGYGPGDLVAAALHVERAEGGIPAGAKVVIRARVDGKQAFHGDSIVDAKGNCVAKFTLPKEIERGEGVLTMAIEDGGVVETASKTLPILLQTVDLTMYPEGGDLVEGFKSRVYFEAFTPAGSPADLAGVVVDQNDRQVTEFRSEHEGRGRFSLTPKADSIYRLKITEPSGIDTEFTLPIAKPQGAVISAQKEVYPAGKRVALRVASNKQPFTVSISKRERVLARRTISETPHKKQGLALKFELPDNVDGVLLATVWDAEGKPLAERLIFRQPAHKLRIKVAADQTRYSPGGSAKLTVETTDEKGRPVSAVVGLTVTDESVLEMIDKREQAPDLRAMVFLEHEVKELADAHVYLDSASQASPRALDLLLGTQGWRRFAFVTPQEFFSSGGDPAWRVLASVVPQIQTLSKNRLFFGRDVRLRGIIAEEQDGAVANENPGNNLKPGNKAREDKKKLAEKPQPALPQAAAPKVALEERAADDEKAELAELVELERLPAQRRLKNLEAGKRAQFGLIAGDRFLRRGLGGRAFKNDFLPVRVYAHSVRPNRKPNDRLDFSETLYWHAGVKTDESGKGRIEFALNDAVTSFRVSADAFSKEGVLGANTIRLESVKPFYIEPKLPLEVTAGDHLQIPLSLVNATQEDLANGSMKVSGLNGPSTVKPFTLAADSRERILMDMLIGASLGEKTVTLDGAIAGYSDKVARKFVVAPRGFPLEDGRGGMLAANGRGEHTFVIPDDVVAGSLSARVVVYPTPLANMTEALQRLIREPNGCFEQTSSTTYPLVMAQQYFMSHSGVDPSLIERSDVILEKGYKRLLGFESSGGGFEWFGRNPGHDALTAYGLLEFTDMSKVRHVDEEMLQRTSDWLLEQRDGSGGFVRKTSTLHTWLADPEIANSYNLWALLEAKVNADLSTEVAWVRDAGEKTQNAYVLALAANALGLANDEEGQNHLLDALAGQQNDQGSIDGATRSVVGSTGSALQIETTALAVMAWLQNPRYAGNVESGIRFLADNCKAGRFGSTQSTILALRAIVAYDASRAKPKSPGTLSLLVDGKVVAEPVKFDESQQGAIELPNISKWLKPGKRRVELVMNDGSPMPYSMTVNMHSLKPRSSAECALRVDVKLQDAQVTEGAATEAMVEVVNTTSEKVPSPIAIIGIPGGLEVRHDQLKELVKQEKIAAYEVKGREVVLYWRVLDVEERVALPLSLVAAIPGSYSGPASRAYLYYTDEHKHWDDGLNIKIKPVVQ